MLAEKSDLAEILSVQKEAFKSVAIEYDDMEMPPMSQNINSIEKEFHNGTVFFKYVRDGRIVGSVRGEIDKDGFCSIGRLVVLPAYQKLGVGNQLMQEAESYFSKCKEYRLFTGEKSHFVINFYKKNGYRIVGKENAGKYFFVNMVKNN